MHEADPETAQSSERMRRGSMIARCAAMRAPME